MKLLQGASYGASALLFLALSVYMLIKTFAGADAKSRTLFAEIASTMAKEYSESQTKQAGDFSTMQMEQYKNFTAFLAESRQRDTIITNEYVQLLRSMQHEMNAKTKVMLDMQKSIELTNSKLIELHSILERNHAEVLMMISTKKL